MYIPSVIIGKSDVLTLTVTQGDLNLCSGGFNAFLCDTNSLLYVRSTNGIWEVDASSNYDTLFYNPVRVITYKHSYSWTDKNPVWTLTTPVFVWLPDEGSEESIQPTVNVAKFGDGYEQRTQLGINPEVQSWTMTFTGSSYDILPIRNFLRKMGAVNAFYWTSPINEGGMYVCRSFPLKKIKASILQLSVKFERVYEARL